MPVLYFPVYKETGLNMANHFNHTIYRKLLSPSKQYILRYLIEKKWMNEHHHIFKEAQKELVFFGVDNPF